MNNKIIEEALFTINQRGNKAEIEAAQNKAKALQDSTFSTVYSAYTRKMIEGAKNGKKEDLSAEKQAFEKRLDQLKIGSILPKYSCPICEDQGYKDGHMCNCLKNEINKILVRESGFGALEDFAKTKFDIFKNAEYMKKVYAKMQEWCHSKFDKNIVYLSGGTGVGKTHLIKCMANELIGRGKLVVLTSAFAMNQDFLKSYSTRDLEEKNNILDKYLDCEVLFIDDLGSEFIQKGITSSFLYQVLNERKIKNRPTVITSNLDLKDLRDYYDERISSRIIDKRTSICLLIDGDDLRLKNR